MSFRTHILITLTLLAGGMVCGQEMYSAGDIVDNFTLVNHATGKEVGLYEFEGKVVFLEWFAWWCPFCQAAAAEVKTGIVDHYKTSGGKNPNGVPVMHVGLNMDEDETETQRFIERYSIEYVLNDFDREEAERFQTGGQPVFAIINGVKNSPSHEQWELLYSRLGYGLENQPQPIKEFRSHINSVKAGVDPDPQLPLEFLNYLINLGILESARDIDLDPDFDGVPNVFEYYFGTDASDTSSFTQPTPDIVDIASARYYALQFVRDPMAVGVEISVEFSNSPSFDSLIGSVPVSNRPLENGLEEVVVRSLLPLSGREFSRLIYRSEDR